jgi:hypothetical protein
MANMMNLVETLAVPAVRPEAARHERTERVEHLPLHLSVVCHTLFRGILSSENARSVYSFLESIPEFWTIVRNFRGCSVL